MSTGWGFVRGFQVGAPTHASVQAGRFFPYGFKQGSPGGVQPPVPAHGGGSGYPTRITRKRTEHEKLTQLIDVMLGGEVLRDIELEVPPLAHVAYRVPRELHDGARTATVRVQSAVALRERIAHLARTLEDEDENAVEILLLYGD